MNRQRATHSFVYRLSRFGLVLVVAISLVDLSVYGAGETVTPSGSFPGPNSLDGVAMMEAYGGIGLTRDANGPAFFDSLWQFQRTPSNESPLAFPFYVGFDAQRDIDLIADPTDKIVGAVVTDGFGGVHTYVPAGAAEPDYHSAFAAYNASNDPDLGLPYFFPWDVVRDLELAPDWRTATNAFQGYYLMDGFGGVHYVNDPQVIAMIQREADAVGAGTRTPSNARLAGTEDFFSVFGFRPVYRRHYVPDYNVFLQNYTPTPGDTRDKKKVWDYLSQAPWGPSAMPTAPDHTYSYFAKDLEVSVRFVTISAPHVANSLARKGTASSLGLAEASLTTPITIPASRAQISNTDYGRDVAVTNGYYILSAYGIVHSMLEDGKGNPIPAPWEDPKTGLFDKRVNAPYFGFEAAEDLELFPSGLGFALLTSYGQVYLASAPGAKTSDSFDLASFSDEDPSDLAPYFGFDIARGLKLVTYVDRQNYGLDKTGDGKVDPADPKHGKIVGYYVIDGFGTLHGIGDVANLPMNGTALPLYSLDITADVEVSPLFRPVTDSVDLFLSTISSKVSPLYYPATDSI
ncbi:MAG: hypothetical protein ABIH23_17315 [bacterium]